MLRVTKITPTIKAMWQGIDETLIKEWELNCGLHEWLCRTSGVPTSHFTKHEYIGQYLFGGSLSDDKLYIFGVNSRVKLFR